MDRPTNKGRLRRSSSWSFKLGSGKGSKTVLGCGHVVKDLLFSKFSTIVTFDFTLILGYFFTFEDPNRLILEVE